MKYRTLGKTGEEVSILGFGAMRLPHFERNDEIDHERSDEILRYGIENGINLIDTAYSYHASNLAGKGKCEEYLGNFLYENSYRDDVLLSTKLPSWLIKTKEDMENIFESQLKDLKTDSIDLYMLHSLNEEYWKMFRELDVFEFMDDLLSSGKVKHIGFSSHTEMDWIVDIVDDYDKFEFGLTQLNYLDERYQSGREGVEYLHQMGLGTMIMEPLRGGRLVQNIPQDIQDLWNLAEERRSPVEWAFQYLWNMEEVDTVLSGMNSIDQLKESIEIANKTEINSISANDLELIKEVAWEYKQRKANDCTGCQYCMPCPHGVDVAGCFREYNVAKMLNNPAGSAMHYFSLDGDTRADKCIHCDDCLNHCPQMIHISEELAKVEEFFGKKYDYF
ncbi:MAG: aldo/keto reductase [Methanobrevibacter sp.]|nr:aldo/keto reductase [Methanobrevibacter sp.]